MAIMIGVVGALSAFYHDQLDVRNPEHRKLCAYRCTWSSTDFRAVLQCFAYTGLLQRCPRWQL